MAPPRPAEARPGRNGGLSFTAEQEFVLALAGGRTPATPPGLDWDGVRFQVDRHALLPALAALPAAQAGPLADDARRRMRTMAARNLELTRLTGEAVQALLAAGIPVAVLKGAVVAELLYGGLAGRQFNDVDLLVRPADFDRAREVIATSLGFRERPPGHRGPPAAETEFFSPQGTRLDLHRFVFPARHGLAEPSVAAIENPCWVRAGGVRLPSLPGGELARMLVLHGAKHRWQRLAWLCDTSRAFDSLDTDWEAVLTRLRHDGNLLPLAVTVDLREQLLGSAPPQWWTPALQNWARGRRRRAVRLVHSNLFLDAPDDLPSAPATLLLHDSRRRGLGLVARLVVTPSDSDADPGTGHVRALGRRFRRLVPRAARLMS